MGEPTASLIADSHGLICAFQLAPLLPVDHDALEVVDPSVPVWLHFNLADGRARDWLSEREDLPETAREALLEDGGHVHVQICPGASSRCSATWTTRSRARRRALARSESTSTRSA